MSIADARSPATKNALIWAHNLVDYGVPIFRGRLLADGNPDPEDRRWRQWQRTKPSHEAIDRWKPGEALCAVTGTTFDVLDIDPRNGGLLSFKRLSRELGDDGPEVYWEVFTPSGGRHLYIAGLNIGKHTGFLKGLDLQGGKDDGTGRGFVFLPPTVRPSKLTGEILHYKAKTGPVRPPATDEGCELLREYITDALGAPADPVYRSGRTPAEQLRKDCIVAEAGEQRPALLRYVHELERGGMDEESIIGHLVLLAREMPVYNTQDPWYPAVRKSRPDWHLRGLLHRKGRVLPDATDEEAKDLEEIQPLRRGLIQYVEEVAERDLAWLWYGRLAFGELTLLDGAKGKGKSFITYDIISCATRGLPMPGEDKAECGPITVLLFTDEGGWDTTIRPRLRAAGANLKRVARVSPAAVRRNWGLPEGAKHIRSAIRECEAGMAIFDPITDMIGEEIQTHNDASVRRALAPLAGILNESGCAGLAIRHFNKATGAGARNRGSGSSAFQNRARVHMITGELPEGQFDEKFGLAIVDTNLTSKSGIEGVWGYNIVDSDIRTGDRQGSYHGKIEWGGIAAGVTADVLADGEAAARGNKTSTSTAEVTVIIEEMFQEKDTWPMTEILGALQEAGVSTRKDILGRVKEALGLRSVPIREKGKPGVRGWEWTNKKAQVAAEGDDDG
ncbi:MAG TPA: AAA family ATPase [Planctomycetota bacterium]|nr:AAA family ATPase [Planctomycetota bacterium]